MILMFGYQILLYIYIIFEEKTSDLPADGAVDVVIVSSGLKMLMNKYLYELIFYNSMEH